MSDSGEKVNRDLANARTLRQRNAILRRFYAEDAGSRCGDDLLEHFLTKLEIVASHLALTSYGRPDLTTVRKSNLTTGIRFYLGAIEEIVTRGESPGYAAIAAIWPAMKNLFATICAYKGEH